MPMSQDVKTGFTISTRVKIGLAFGLAALGIAAAFLLANRQQTSVPVAINCAKLQVPVQNISSSAVSNSTAATTLRQAGTAWKSVQNDRPALQRALANRYANLVKSVADHPDEVLDTVFDPITRKRLAAVVPDCVEQPISFAGKLSIEHFDDFKNKVAVAKYAVTAANGTTYYIYLAHAAQAKLSSGMQVQVKGLAFGTGRQNILVDAAQAVADQSELGLTVQQTATSSPVIGDQHPLVILANFSDCVSGSPTNPCFTSPTTGEVSSIMFDSPNGTNGVNSYYYENSYHQITISGTVTPWLKVASITQSQAQSACSSYGDLPYGFANEAVTAAQTNGINIGQFSEVLVVPALNNCGNWAGHTRNITWQPPVGSPVSFLGALILAPYANHVLVLGHELGHNFGLGETGFLNCGSNSLTPPTAGDSCGVYNYGDVSTIMSATTLGQFTASQKDFVGWLTPSTLAVAGFETRTYNLEPIETTTGGLKAIKIPRGNGQYLYVEYRQPIGYDSNIGQQNPTADMYQGALLHFANSDLRIDPAYLVDATPPPDNQSLPMQVSLRPSTTFTDVDGLTHAVISVGTSQNGALPVTVTLTQPKTFAELPTTVAMTAPVHDMTINGNSQMTVTATPSNNRTVTATDLYSISAYGWQRTMVSHLIGSATAASYKTFIDTFWPAGESFLYAVDTDSSGATLRSDILPISIRWNDTVAPTVSLTQPTAGAVLSNPVTFSVTARDNLNIGRFVLSIDGKPAGFDNGAFMSGSQTMTTAFNHVNISNFYNNRHTATVAVYDTAGNRTDSAAVSFTVQGGTSPDTEAPTMAVTPASGMIHHGIIMMKATASDASGIQKTAVFDGTGSDPIAFGQLVTDPAGNYYQFVFDARQLADGSHTLHFRAWDQYYNTTDIPTVVNIGSTDGAAGGPPRTLYEP